jgi:hypothetical protein
MAGSNLVLVKRRLADVLPGQLQIVFDYAYNGRHHEANREYGWLGERASGPVAPAAMAGGARFLRLEELTLQLALAVRRPGADPDVAEADALEIGARLEEFLAGNWLQGSDIPGLLKILITDMELEVGVDDDGSTATLAYTIQLSSHVR